MEIVGGGTDGPCFTVGLPWIIQGGDMRASQWARGFISVSSGVVKDSHLPGLLVSVRGWIVTVMVLLFSLFLTCSGMVEFNSNSKNRNIQSEYLCQKGSFQGFQPITRFQM